MCAVTGMWHLQLMTRAIHLEPRPPVSPQAQLRGIIIIISTLHQPVHLLWAYVNCFGILHQLPPEVRRCLNKPYNNHD